MHRSFVRFALTLLFVAGITRAESPPLGQLPAGVTPLAYTLDLRIDPDAARFSGRTRIHVRLAEPADHIWLHARELDITQAETIDARATHRSAAVAAADASGIIRLDFGAVLPAQELDLAFEYSAPFNAKLQGLYKIRVGEDSYVVSQMEAVSARYAFPSFDEPRFKTPFDVTLTVPRAAVAIANTRPRFEADAGGGFKTVAYARTQPLPTYLVAFAVGPWDVADAPPIAANAVRRRPLPLRAIGPRGTAPQLRWILRQVPAIVAFFEDYAQQPFPFDKLDLLGAPDFAAGAMENAGLIVFRDALLRIDGTSPAGMERSSFEAAAHEIAHQWFGDLVTVPWWDDIWLNEAFATWAQGNATVALKPAYLGELARAEAAFDAMANDSLLSARRVRQPVASQDDIETAFDTITYQKGAALLRMVEQWLGPSRYRDAMRGYLARHAHGSGSSDDLIAAIVAAGRRGAAPARVLRSFLDQPGIPLLRVRTSCRAGQATLIVDQSRYLPFGVLDAAVPLWSVPLCVRLGHGTASVTQCVLLERARQTFAIEGACPDWILPNPNAAGYYRFALGGADFAALTRRLDALAPAEQLVVADALNAAFAHGDLGPEALLDALPAFAASAYPQVALALAGNLAWIREHVATDATRPALDAYVTRLYEPRLDALGWQHRPGEPDAQARLRQRLAWLLALEVRAPRARAALAEQGRRALGLAGNDGVDLTRVDPDLRGFALRVAVQDLGAPAFAAALDELRRTADAQETGELVIALGGSRDPALAARVRTLGLSGAIPVDDLPWLYAAQVMEPENRIAFEAWYREHFDALRARYPDAYQRALPGLPATGRCTRAEATALQEWFAPRIDAVVGGARALAQALEDVNRCAALREHVGTQALTRWAEAQNAP